MIPGYVVWVLWVPVAAYVGYRHRPVTFVCAALWPRLRAWKWAFVLGVGWSAAIEIMQ